jgi:hypothetical protein
VSLAKYALPRFLFYFALGSIEYKFVIIGKMLTPISLTRTRRVLAPDRSMSDHAREHDEELGIGHVEKQN